MTYGVSTMSQRSTLTRRPAHSRPQQCARRRAQAFTLLELLLAVAISAVVAAVLYASMAVAFRTREVAMSDVELSAAGHAAIASMRSDLTGVLPPTGLLAGEFVGEDEVAGSDHADRLTFVTTNTMWSIQDPIGELTRVEIYLDPPDTATSFDTDTPPQGGRLIRATTVNLLATTTPTATVQTLADHVLAFNVTYFDGESWLDEWRSADEDNALPVAVTLTLEFAQPTTNRRAGATATSGEPTKRFIVRQAFNLLPGRSAVDRAQEQTNG